MTKEILEKVRQAAVEYHKKTGQILAHPTGVIGEFEAADKLGLKLAPAGNAGYDATSENGRMVQIKTRLVKERYSKKDGSPQVGGQRMGRIDPTKEFDSVMLVLLRESYDVYGIWEVERAKLVDSFSDAELRKGPHVPTFQKIAKKIWPYCPY